MLIEFESREKREDSISDVVGRVAGERELDEDEKRKYDGVDWN